MGRKSENRELILQTAGYLFWTRGFEAVGVNDICEEASINKGTLYHFFENKKELVLAVIDDNTDYLLDLFAKTRAKPPRERILYFFDKTRLAQADHCQRTEQLAGCPFGNLGMELAGQDEDIRLKIENIFARHVDFISEALAEQRGLTKRQTRSDATHLFTHWQGAMLMAKTSNSLKPLESARSYIRDFLNEN